MEHIALSPEEDNLPVTVPQDDSKIRRKLVDIYETDNSTMNIYLRLRPFTEKERNNGETEACVSKTSNEEVLLTAPSGSATFRHNVHDASRIKQRFTFTRVFGSACTQSEFYDGAVAGTIKEFIKGQNCLVFAYGATNSGKTYTIQGSKKQPGIIPSSLKAIFVSVDKQQSDAPLFKPKSYCSAVMVENQVKEKQFKELVFKDVEMSNFGTDSLASSRSVFETTYEPSSTCSLDDINEKIIVWISFAEVYNEQLFDLLAQKRQTLTLVHDSEGNNTIKGLNRVWVRSFEEAESLLYLGRKNLHMASTNLNHQSSRSHCIYTVYMVRLRGDDNELNYVNSLSFCDLAGSERMEKTQNTGQRLREAGNINTSLMVLGRCIESLKTNQQNKRDKNIVPYRDSKLTRLFQTFFSGKGKASMIVNIGPSQRMFDDNLNVLKFSALAKQIVTKDYLEKSTLNLTASVHERLTNIWIRSNSRFSSFLKQREDTASKMSILTIPEEANLSESVIEMTQDDIQQNEELVEMFSDLEKRLAAAEQALMDAEATVRAEVCSEFEVIINEMNEAHEQELKRQGEIDENFLQKRTKLLENHIATLRNELRMANESSESESEHSFDPNTSKIDKLEKSFAEIEKQKDLEDKKKALIEEACSKLAAAEKELIALKQQNEQIVGDNQAQSDGYIKEIDSLKIKLDAQLQSSMDQLKESKAKLEAHFRSILDELERDLAFANAKAQKYECEHSIQQDKLAASQAEITTLSCDLERAMHEINSLRTEKNMIEGEVEARALTVKKSQDVLNTMEVRCNVLESENTSLKHKIVELEENISKDDKQTEEFKSTKIEIEKLIAENQTLKAESIDSKAKLSAKKLDMDKLGDILLEKDSEISTLQAELEKQKQINTSMKKTVDELKDLENFQPPRARKVGRRTKPTTSITEPEEKEIASSPDFNESYLTTIGNMVNRSPTFVAVKNAFTVTVEKVKSFSSPKKDLVIPSETLKTQGASNTGAGETTIAKRTRRQLHKEVNEVLECSPPKVTRVASVRRMAMRGASTKK